MKVGRFYLFKYKLLNEKSDIFSDIIMETIFIWRNMTKSTVALSRVCRAPASPTILWKKSVYQSSFTVTLSRLSLKLWCWPIKNFTKEIGNKICLLQLSVQMKPCKYLEKSKRAVDCKFIADLFLSLIYISNLLFKSTISIKFSGEDYHRIRLYAEASVRSCLTKLVFLKNFQKSQYYKISKQ